MKSHSTGALSPEQQAAQDELYRQNHEYDYLIIGSGIAALSVSSLLVNQGYKVCILEAHDVPGGYGHTFKMGDYHFCAQIHYVWGCGPGDTLDRFTRKLGLEKELEFVPYDADGYDHMDMPDGKSVRIPYGYDRLIENIDEAYPGHREKVKKFLDIVNKVFWEAKTFPSTRNLKITDLATQVWKYKNLLKYRFKTLQDVFDECQLPIEIQTVLAAQAGDFAEPPEDLSIFAFAGLFGGYNLGTYYPKKHFKFYVERLAKFITDHEGCHIYYETPATKINIKDGQVISVESNDKTFTAKNYICNADPQSTAKKLIGWDHVPKKYRKALSYEYSSSGLMIYLGLKDIDLKKYGLGSFNIWKFEDWDVNKLWKANFENKFDKTWFFLSTASMHSHEPGIAPPGHHVMEIATFIDFQTYRDLKEQDPKLYRQKKMELAEHLLDLVEKYYIPDLRDHIAIKVVGTPSTNLDYVKAPFGNSYGSRMIPKQVGIGRLKADSPWSNFWWCNASSGFAGFHGTTSTGMALYSRLTGDELFPKDAIPKEEDLLKYAREAWEKHKNSL